MRDARPRILLPVWVFGLAAALAGAAALFMPAMAGSPGWQQWRQQSVPAQDRGMQPPSSPPPVHRPPSVLQPSVPGPVPPFRSSPVPALTNPVPPFSPSNLPPPLMGSRRPFLPPPAFHHRPPRPAIIFPFPFAFFEENAMARPANASPTPMVEVGGKTPVVERPDFKPHVITLSPASAEQEPGTTSSVTIIRPGQPDEVVRVPNRAAP